MEFLRDVELANFTTFNLGGRARYFARVFSLRELKEAIDLARRKELPFFVLGKGSNVLVSDSGFRGLVIKNDIGGMELDRSKGRRAWITAGAGENWDDVVEFAVSNKLAGLEALSGIPGSAGASAVQNIGAYGIEAADYLDWVEVFDPKTFLTYRISRKDCELGYRNSIFKEISSKHLIVTKVCFDLYESDVCVKNPSHPRLLEYFSDVSEDEYRVEDIRKAVTDLRNKNLPLLYNLGTAGSFFKNPVLSTEQLGSFLAEYPSAPYYDEGEGFFKVPAGWLIENVGNFKGCCFGRAGVWERHALILVNRGGSSAEEVKILADTIALYVKERTGIDLEWEVVYVR